MIQGRINASNPSTCPPARLPACRSACLPVGLPARVSANASSFVLSLSVSRPPFQNQSPTVRPPLLLRTDALSSVSSPPHPQLQSPHLARSSACTLTRIRAPATALAAAARAAPSAAAAASPADRRSAPPRKRA
eukprot:3773638-Pleurochrysis_carterae.AAC.1